MSDNTFLDKHGKIIELAFNEAIESIANKAGDIEMKWASLQFEANSDTAHNEHRAHIRKIEEALSELLEVYLPESQRMKFMQRWIRRANEP